MHLRTLVLAALATATALALPVVPRVAGAQTSNLACIRSGDQPLYDVGYAAVDACFRTTSTPSQRLVYTNITTRIPNLTLARRITSCKLYSYVNTGSRTNNDSFDCTVNVRSNAGGYTLTRNFGPYPYTCSSYLLLNSRLVIRYTDNAGVGRVMSKPVAISGPACR